RFPRAALNEGDVLEGASCLVRVDGHRATPADTCANLAASQIVASLLLLSSRPSEARAGTHLSNGPNVGVDGSSTASMCQNEVVADLIQEEPSVNDLIRIGMDTSKSVFVLHGVDVAEQPVLRKTLRRRQVIEFFARLPPTRVGMEACGAAHHW